MDAAVGPTNGPVSVWYVQAALKFSMESTFQKWENGDYR